ncbi:hypothetical protein K1719_009616 [Acacia pycnantha]|nr:hypothetical protein K1719_009616 [Acacia pycnantha]
MVVRCSLGSKGDGSLNANGLPFTPNKLFMQEAIGAEYGEGFETFRADGLFKVDVDYLNEKLQDGFLQRIRYAMKPDEAYGLIFSGTTLWLILELLDGMHRSDLLEEGKDIPEDGGVERSLLYSGADYML